MERPNDILALTQHPATGTVHFLVAASVESSGSSSADPHPRHAVRECSISPPPDEYPYTSHSSPDYRTIWITQIKSQPTLVARKQRLEDRKLIG